ncbi:hypothetical protein CF319_g9092 [Tilletia indica]|nr:hypothetical protein CF319_g9092 [Tilletia indica]
MKKTRQLAAIVSEAFKDRFPDKELPVSTMELNKSIFRELIRYTVPNKNPKLLEMAEKAWRATVSEAALEKELSAEEEKKIGSGPEIGEAMGEMDVELIRARLFSIRAPPLLISQVRPNRNLATDGKQLAKIVKRAQQVYAAMQLSHSTITANVLVPAICCAINGPAHLDRQNLWSYPYTEASSKQRVLARKINTCDARSVEMVFELIDLNLIKIESVSDPIAFEKKSNQVKHRHTRESMKAEGEEEVAMQLLWHSVSTYEP